VKGRNLWPGVAGRKGSAAPRPEKTAVFLRLARPAPDDKPGGLTRRRPRRQM